MTNRCCIVSNCKTQHSPSWPLIGLFRLNLCLFKGRLACRHYLNLRLEGSCFVDKYGQGLFVF